MRKVGLMGLSFILVIILLLGLFLVMSFVNPIVVRVVNASPTLSCNVPASYPTIQSAVNDAACDEIIIAAGTYSESLVITRSVAIQGAGINQTILNNDLQSRVVEIPSYGSFGPDVIVSISDLNIDEGYDTVGGGIFNEETLILDNVSMSNNIADSGGAIYSYSYAVTTIKNSSFFHNQATGLGAYDGASIHSYALGGMLTISDTVISTGLSGSGVYSLGPAFIYGSEINGHEEGGLYMQAAFTMVNTIISSNAYFGIAMIGSTSDPMIVSISGSTIENNSDPYFNGSSGEGLAVIANVNLTVDNSTIQQNAMAGISGQNQFTYDPVITITNSIIQDNYDGGVETVGDLTIFDSQISGNTRTQVGNGGVHIVGADLYIERSSITNNLGNICGGGVLVDGGLTRIRDTTIAFNQSLNGAGLCVYDGGDARIRQSAVYSNTTTGDGGGISVGHLGYTGTLVVANSTIANNYADGDGGGIYALRGDVSLTNVTIAKNFADSENNATGEGGGFLVDTVHPVQFNMVNTLVATNKLGNGTPSDCDGTIISGGANLVRVADTCSGLIVANDLYGSSGSPLNANLKALQDRGSYTWVIPFGVNSPAADAGKQTVCANAPINNHDQRGYSRVNIDGNEDGGGDGNRCDIGAFERNAAPDYMVYLPLIIK